MFIGMIGNTIMWVVSRNNYSKGTDAILSEVFLINRVFLSSAIFFAGVLAHIRKKCVCIKKFEYFSSSIRK